MNRQFSFNIFESANEMANFINKEKVEVVGINVVQEGDDQIPKYFLFYYTEGDPRITAERFPK